MRCLEYSKDELEIIKPFNFITLKKIIFVANVDDSEVASSKDRTSALINPLSKSVWIIPAHSGAFIPSLKISNTKRIINVKLFNKINKDEIAILLKNRIIAILEKENVFVPN